MNSNIKSALKSGFYIVILVALFTLPIITQLSFQGKVAGDNSIRFWAREWKGSNTRVIKEEETSEQLKDVVIYETNLPVNNFHLYNLKNYTSKPLAFTVSVDKLVGEQGKEIVNLTTNGSDFETLHTGGKIPNNLQPIVIPARSSLDLGLEVLNYPTIDPKAVVSLDKITLQRIVDNDMHHVSSLELTLTQTNL